MGQKKLIRFAEIETFPNVFQYPKHMKGNWKDFYGNDRPITLELACGKGEYTIGQARLFPDRNFLGMDLKGNRIWVGAKIALKESLTNVAFVRSHIDKITDYFAPGEVNELWLTFPDPQLRVSKAKKRLTHPKFLRLYQQIMPAGGYIHLKTDSPVLYRFTKDVIRIHELETIVDNDNLYASAVDDPVLLIQTHYEKLDIAKSNRVHYLKFKLPPDPLSDKDTLIKEITLERESSD